MWKPLERGGKRLLLHALRPLLPRIPLPAGGLVPGSLRRVLVIRPDGRLGNLLLITPFLARLREGLPEARIELLVSEAFPQVFNGSPRIDGLIVAPKRALARNPLGVVPFLRRLRARRFDCAIDASHSHSFSVTSGLAARLSGAPVQISFRRGESPLFLNMTVPPPPEGLHESAIPLALLEPLGIKAAPGPLEYYLLPEERAWGRRFADEQGWGEGPLAGIFLGGRKHKRWPLAGLLAIARVLVGRGKGTVVLFTGPGEAELVRSALTDLRRGASMGTIAGCPPLPLRRFAAVLACCRLLVTSDSGPLHLAGALGVPTLALFRVDNRQRYGPLGPRDIALYEPHGLIAGEAIGAAQRLWEGE